MDDKKTDIEEEIVDVEEEIIEDEDNSYSMDKIKKLKEELAQVKKEKQEYLNSWQKERADFINARKRDEEEKIEFLKYANSQILTEIISIIDNYEQAKIQESWNNIDEVWRTGIESILNKMYSILESNKVISFGEKNDIFDPAIHQAIGNDEGGEENKISQVLQKGYKMNGKVIRNAMVRVFN